MNVLMAINATTKATKLPIPKSINSLDPKLPPPFIYFKNLYAVAASIVGTAKKNENSAADFLFSFCCIPPIMVAADLETPGIMAIH